MAASLREHGRFLVTTHENPDGDALGSLLASKLALEQLGKDATMYLGGEAPLPAEYSFMELDGLLRQVPEDAGVPDGLCVDVEGGVWSAHWGGWRLTRYDPDGRIERVIELPAAQITCPTFGGPDLEVLYVSSAAIGMSASDFAKAPDAGGLFALEVGVRGLPANRFAA